MRSLIPGLRAAAMPLLPVALAIGLLAGCQSNAARHDEHPQWLADMLPAFATTPSPAEAARDAFNVYSADRRREGIDRLSAAPFGDEPLYVRIYRLLIDDPDPAVRASCAKALGMHGDPADVEAIVPLLDDDAAFLRWEAAKALQRLHNPLAAQPLMDRLRNDEDGDVRMAAASALGQYPTTSVFHTLVGALHDSNYGVARAARRSLRTLTGHDHGPEARDWLAWADEQSSVDLFTDGRTYTYQPWSPPPGTLRRMQIWRDSDPAPDRRVPAGLDPPSRG